MNGDYIDHCDRLTARLAQASGVIAAMQTQYDNQKEGEKEHMLPTRTMEHALWALSELLDDAVVAARELAMRDEPKPEGN